MIQIQPFSVFVEYFPQDGDAILLQPFVRWSISPSGELTVSEPKPRFEFVCNVLANAEEAFAAYISESERKARESWKRF